MNELANLVAQIRIDSEYGPPIVIDQPFSASPSATGGSAILGFLKPQITIVPVFGGDQVVAPWGRPGPNKWPMVEAALIVALILGVVLLIR